MSISIQVYILSIIGIALLGLSFWIRNRYQNSHAIHYYSFFLFSLAVMALVSGATFFPFSLISMLWVTRLGYLSGLMSFCMLLMFSFFYPIPNKSISAQISLFWVVPTAILGTLILTSQLFLQGVYYVGTVRTESHGSLYWLFPSFVIFSLFFALANFSRKKLMVQGKDRVNLRIFIIILIVDAILGMIFDVLWPALGGPRLFIGVYSTAILFAIATYTVYQK